jgi:hypothetical protein
MTPPAIPFSALALCLLASVAAAGGSADTNNKEPGSLLVYPIFDNTQGATVITVTNTNSDFTPGPGFGQFAGSIRVEFVYLNSVNCLEVNRTRTLTPNDEFTIITSLDNPSMQEGYLYVFAKSLTTGQAVKFDWLIGTEWQLDAVLGGAYEIDPYIYKAGGRLAQGANTDLDNDGIRDLNGSEYGQSPDHILVPRFFGQVPGTTRSDIVLINLSGGAAFYANANFLVYNDNEEVYSTQYNFRCWARVPLASLSGIFQNDFLLSGGHAPGENSGIQIGGSPVETGWYRVDGGSASSGAATIVDPAILVVHIESLGTFGFSANLPFTTGSQDNGDLIPHGVLGDTN